MKFIKSFNLFESVHEETEDYNELMGKLLHLYGSIPIPKAKSAIVIKKIILHAEEGKLYELGQDININYMEPHDKIRFCDYFDSLLSDKDARGHNFEGLICGLFGGQLSPRGVKYDLTINGLKYSVKFVDHKNKAPEIGRFKNFITKRENLNNIVKDGGGLTRVFKSYNERLKSGIWNLITEDIDGWILSYPDNINQPQKIILNIINKSEMFEIIDSGLVVAPKGGYDDLYSLALSSKYVSFGNFRTSEINIPQVTYSDLKEEYRSIEEDNWARKVFGEMGAKIRPDVITYIKKNKEEIIDNLTNI